MGSGKNIIYCEKCGEMNWDWNKSCWNCHIPFTANMVKLNDLVIPLKCDLCTENAIWFSSPLLNPNEPKLCNEHYNKYKEELK